MRRIILLWLCLVISSLSYSQVITILDQKTDKPLPFATLLSEKPKAFTTSNTEGQADIAAFKGAEKISIRSLGYKTEVTSYNNIKSQDFVIRLTPGQIMIDEVVISATRWNQPLHDAPVKISSISAKDVALENPQTAADLLGTSGEVFIQKSQLGGGSPMIRGFSTNRLLYTVDGVRMNTAIFRSGNLQNVISLDPFEMETVEVLFGPGSVIYGSDAIGGVMSFQTLNPQLSLTDKPLITGNAVTRYSSASNEKTMHFDINAGWKKWALLSSFSSFDFGDLKMGSKGPDEYLRPFYVQRQDSTDVVITNEDPKVQKPTGYSQINMMQKVRFSPNERWDIVYGFHYSETSDYSRYDRHIRNKNGLPRYGEWYYGPQKWMMNNLNITHHAEKALFDQVTLRLAQQTFHESRISRDFNKPDKEIRKEKVLAYSANLDFNKLIGTKNNLFYGLEYVLNDVNSDGINENISTGSSVIGPSRYPGATWVSLAAYVTNQFKVSEKFSVQAGLRYNQYILNADFDTTFYPIPYPEAEIKKGSLTGSLGFVYTPSEEWVLNANFATGFRSPNVDDMGKVFDSEPGSVVVPNRDLEAEYAYNFEVGALKVFNDILKVDLTAYYTILNNAMVRRDYTLNGLDSIMYDGTLSRVQAIQNAAIANVYGIQAGVEIKLPSGFGFSSIINYQKGEEELDDGTTSPSRHAPPVFGVSKIIYSFENLVLELYAQYSGEKKFEDMPLEEIGKDYMYAPDDNGNPYSPGWYTLNFKAMYSFAKNFSVSAGLENITDQRYRPYSSGIVAPGRNFIISLRAGF